jgi:hypothetical protein
MSMDIIQGALAGVSAHEASKQIDAILPQDDHPLEHKLDVIIDHLIAIQKQLETPTAADIPKVVVLYKDTFGPGYVPRGETRQHIWILTGVSTPLSVITGMLGTFVFTVSPGIWTLLDFPDGTMYKLDATATSNQQNTFFKFTNDDNSR